MSMSRSMQLLNTQPDATTREVPMTAARNTTKSMCPLEARKKPPATESTLPKMIPGLVIWIKCFRDMRFSSVRHHYSVDTEHDPERQTDQQHNDHRCESKRCDVVTLSLRTVQVQEVHQVNQDLNHGEDQNDPQGGGLGHSRVHHQTKRDDCQDYRQYEADDIRLDATVTGIIVMRSIMVRHLQGPHQINNGEYADPDHVQEVPEQAQAAQASLVGVGQAVFIDLIHHHRHPDQASRHVQTVGPHQREEPRQEAAAVRAEAFGDQQVKLVDLHADEAQTEHEGQTQPGQYALLVALVEGQQGEAVGDRTEQQQGGFAEHVRQFEDVVARRATRYVVYQYRVHREDRRKQDAVGHQVEPETVNGYRARVGVMVIVPMVIDMGVSSIGH